MKKETAKNIIHTEYHENGEVVFEHDYDDWQNNQLPLTKLKTKINYGYFFTYTWTSNDYGFGRWGNY